MKTFLIIGCNGFIGKKFCQYLLNTSNKVIGVDIAKSEIKDPNFSFYLFNDNYKFADSLINEKINVAYVLSWIGVSTTDKNDAQKQSLNIPMISLILKELKILNVDKIVITGSTSEFAYVQGPIKGTEDDCPADLYAKTKAIIRKQSYDFCRANNIDLNWLLITSIYSEDRRDANLIYSVIKAINNQETIKTTKLEQRWDYLHIDDLLQALYLVGLKGEKFCVYPVGSGISKQLYEYVKNISDIMDGSSYIKIGALEYKKSIIDNSVPDISKLKNIGYAPKHNYLNDIKFIIDRICNN